MKTGENGTVLVQGKFAIYSQFLDRTLQVEVKMLDGESIKDAVKRVNKELEETAAELKKDAESMRGETIRDAASTRVSVGPSPYGGGDAPEPIIRSKQPEGERVALLIADIKSCSDLKVLEGYRLLARAKPILQAVYDEMKLKLSIA